MDRPLRIGIIGVDTSHAVDFVRLLNDQQDPHHVPGGQVVVAYPGGSRDMELSISRVKDFTEHLRDGYGVKIVETPTEVAEQVDVVLIESVDGRVHLHQFKEICHFRRPTFIDKPFAISSADAREMYRLADQHGVTLMSSSALRYAEGLVEALAVEPVGADEIIACEAYGPLPIEPTQNHFFFYGIHTAEMLSAVMGTGCKEVEVASDEKADVIRATWADGRVGTIRGIRDGHSQFGAVIHRKSRVQEVDCTPKNTPWSVGVLQAVMDRLSGGAAGKLWRATNVGSVSHVRRSHHVDPEPAATMEIVRLLEAANESLQSRKPVAL